MSKPTIKGKRARYYRLIKDDVNEATCCLLEENNTIDNDKTVDYNTVDDNEIVDDETVNNETVNDNTVNDEIDDNNETVDDNTIDDNEIVDDNNISFKDKLLNKLFKGKRELYKFYNIKSCPMNYIIKMKTLNERGKRTRAYWLIII